MLPSILVYSIYIMLPIFIAVGYSLTKYTGIGKPKFIGLLNYERMLADKVFWISFRNTMITPASLLGRPSIIRSISPTVSRPVGYTICLATK